MNITPEKTRLMQSLSVIRTMAIMRIAGVLVDNPMATDEQKERAMKELRVLQGDA